MGRVGIWQCWGVRRDLSRGRRLSPGAKECCRCLGKSLLDGLCRRRLGVWMVWCDDAFFFTCLQLGIQLRLAVDAAHTGAW